MTRITLWMLSACLFVFVTGSSLVSGQTFPTKPIRIVVGDVGGSTDFVGRIIAQGITGPMGQPVIVQNRGGSDLPQVVASSQPDGYTLLLNGSTVWLLPYLQDNAPYDPVRDFSPITLITSAPQVLVMHPSAPVKSVKELIALAKAKPGELNFSSSPAGGSSHLAGELFKAMAGVKITWIGYKGSGPALIALLGGEVQMSFTSPISATQQVKAGKLRALAVTSPEPSALSPGLPAIAETLPGYESRSVQGIWAPAKTPVPVIRRLNQEIVRALNQPDVKQKVFANGSEVVGDSPEQFSAMIKNDMARMGKVIKDAHIHID